jgi:hypothetical protein
MQNAVMERKNPVSRYLKQAVAAIIGAAMLISCASNSATGGKDVVLSSS